MSLRSQFGAAKSGNGPGYKNFKVEDGKSFVFRLIPPIKSLQPTGTWFVFQRQHFGYKGTDPADPNKTKVRTFACIEEQNRQTKMITVSCPECRLIEAKEQFKADLESTERARLKAQGIENEQEVQKYLGPLLQPTVDWLSAHNLDKKYAYNVMSEAGEFGVLRLGYKAHKQLEKIKEDLKGAGVDIFDLDNGRFLSVSRSGKGFSTEYKVELAYQTVVVDGQNLLGQKKSALTDEQLEKALASLPDLGSFSSAKLTPEQIRLLVEGSGDPGEVDMIFNMGQRIERSPARPAPATQQAPAPAPTQSAPVPTPAPAPANDEMAMLQAQMAELQAKLAKQVAAGTAAPVASAPAPTKPAAAPALDPSAAAAAFLAAYPVTPSK